ncbi:MAG: 3'-5' exonuclease [Gammaproteobacteria bacterium]|nr:3'-5' exonuclease [Gammaproteobacteria bacterium]
MTVFVFDIETVPDVETGRRLLGLDGLSDKDVANVMFQQRRQETGHEFLRHHLQRIVAISVAMRGPDKFTVWTLGDIHSTEKELVERFFHGIEKYTPTLVSWNGKSFDLPVLHYRALLHGVNAQRYWETGEQDNNFRWNNYLNRFHYRHTDLMDVLAGYELRAVAPLHEIALMLGLPGKLGMDGAQVWPAFQAGELQRIRDYCETDVINTYLVYLRFQRMRGVMDTHEYQQECAVVREALRADGRDHLQAFIHAWQGGS